MKPRNFSKWVKSAIAMLLTTSILTIVFFTAPVPTQAYQGMPTPKLHVTGRYFQDPNGKNVTLHGYMQAGHTWFNGEGNNYTNPTDFTSTSNVAGMLNFYNSVADIMSNTNPLYGQSHGWYCNYVRLCGDATDNGFAAGWDINGKLSNPAQFNGWINNVLVPYVNHCKADGLYVIICGTPSQTYPNNDKAKNMTYQFQQNLITFWSTLASNPGLKSADNVLFEICNEPITIESSFGANDWGNGSDKYWAALTNFMQPIVNAIRQQSADNIILVPGLGYSGEYSGFVNHPIQNAGNIGYAAHIYPAYGGAFDNATTLTNLWNTNYKPAADQLPMVITEMFWDPNNGQGYQNLWNATTAGFGNTIKSLIDNEGNVSYQIGMVADLLANLTSGLSATTLSSSQGAQAAFSWWGTYTWTAPTTPANGPTAGVYEVSPKNATNLAMEVYYASSSNGARIDQYTYFSQQNQKFYFHPMGNNIYWLEPQNALGKCLDIINQNPNNGSGMQIWDYWGGLGQLWYVINLGNGYYRLSPVLNPSQCLDEPSGSTQLSLYLQIFTYYGADAQQWKLTSR